MNSNTFSGHFYFLTTLEYPTLNRSCRRETSLQKRNCKDDNQEDGEVAGDPPDVARAWIGVGVLLAGGLHQHQVGA